MSASMSSRPRRSRWAFVAPVLLLATSGCGTEAPSVQLSFDLFISRALADEVHTFQIAFAPELDCATLERRCLIDQVTEEDLLEFAAPGGGTRRAAYIRANLRPDEGTQEMQITGLPPSEDLTMVFEAMSGAPELLAHSCVLLEKVNAGTNPPVDITLAPFPQGKVACDPRIER